MMIETAYETTTHKVNLTGGEISTILYYLDQLKGMGYNLKPALEVQRIYAELQSVTDNYYAYQEELDRVKQYKNC